MNGGPERARCSRRDLLEIAHLMPPRHAWMTQAFDDQKEKAKSRFQLSNRQFSNALNAIQRNREMAAILGIENDLLHLTDDDVVWIGEQWRRLHPVRDKVDDDLGLDYFDTSRFEAMQEEATLFAEVIDAIRKRLSADELADLETIFYLERDRVFTEYYGKRVEEARREHAAAKDPQEEIRHLLEKTNLLQCLERGTARLGRLVLAERLKAI